MRKTHDRSEVARGISKKTEIIGQHEYRSGEDGHLVTFDFAIFILEKYGIWILSAQNIIYRCREGGVIQLVYLKVSVQGSREIEPHVIGYPVVIPE